MECYNCKSNTTYIAPVRPKYEEWRFDKNGNRLCLKCYNRLIYIPEHKEQRKVWAKKTRQGQKGRRIYYKGKRIIAKEVVRTGICIKCNNGIIQFTHIHHEFYDDDNPLNGIVELCPRHHLEESKRLKQFHNRWE